MAAAELVLLAEDVSSDEVAVAPADDLSPVALAVELTRTKPVADATPRVALPAGKKVAVVVGGA